MTTTYKIISAKIISAALISATILSGCCTTQMSDCCTTHHSTETLSKPTMPNVHSQMFSAHFWIQKQKHPNALLMNDHEVAAYNERIIQTDLGVINPIQFPEEMDGAEIKKMILENTTGRIQVGQDFVEKKATTPEFEKQLFTKLNMNALVGRKKILPALAVRRTVLHTFPSAEKLYSNLNNEEFDKFIESAVPLGNPLLVLHESTNGLWKYVQSPEVDGWVLASDIAIAQNRAQWESYINAKNKLVILASQLRLGVNPYTPQFSNLLLTMGNAYPLVDNNERSRFLDRMETSGQYIIKLPVRNTDGSLDFKPALVPFSADVHVGYLPFTQAHLVKQAFKAQGERYGWGGDFESRDCSLFVADVYRSMGFVFPRNSRMELALPGKEIKFDKLAPMSTKEAEVTNSPPGTLLGWKGHIMIYLGEHEGHQYVIHAGAGFIDDQSPEGKKDPQEAPLNQVSVTDLSTTRKIGKSYLDLLTILKTIR